ncbi:MAG: hypothetical protein IPG24_01440 [Leptospiraceae bacterium]|nr:hypothetical protein [Leptospiraceae bacterium]
MYFGFLFNEAEKGINDEEKIFDGHSETIHVKSFARKKVGRKPLPEHLPRGKEEIIHDIPESEKICNCGHDLKRIGEEIFLINPHTFLQKFILKDTSVLICSQTLRKVMKEMKWVKL